MKGRRSYLHAAMACLLGFIIVSTGAFQAATTLVDGRGHLLSVEVRRDPAEPALQGLYLVDRDLRGVTIEEPILPTYDTVLDTSPNLAINPLDGEPVVVWSRDDGADLELALARRLPGGGWTSIDLLTDNTTSDSEPRLAIDGFGRAHVIWRPAGMGGPIYLQSFEATSGLPVTQPQQPFERPGLRHGRMEPRPKESERAGGGSDDPGIITAQAYPCPSNPDAQPEHGVVLGCGRPAAYQLSACRLVVGTMDPVSRHWVQRSADLAEVSLENTSTREIVQAMADSRCN